MSGLFRPVVSTKAFWSTMWSTYDFGLREEKRNPAVTICYSGVYVNLGI
jgi:hypothetical protein